MMGQIEKPNTSYMKAIYSTVNGALSGDLQGKVGKSAPSYIKRGGQPKT